MNPKTPNAVNMDADVEANMAPAAALSPEAYRSMLEVLRDGAKREAARLNLDWAALMERTPEQHSPAKQALTILQLGLFDEDWYLATYSDVKAAGFDAIVPEKAAA